MTEVLKPEIRCTRGSMCVNGTPDTGVSRSDLPVKPSIPQSSATAGVIVTHSSRVSRARLHEERNTRLRSNSASRVSVTPKPEALSSGQQSVSETGRRPDNTVAVAVSSDSQPPLVEVHLEPQVLSRPDSEQCSNEIRKPGDSREESQPEADLQRCDSEWCVIETPTAPGPLEGHQPEPEAQGSHPSTVGIAKAVAPAPKTRLPRLQLSAESKQFPRRNSTCCVTAQHGQRASRAELAPQAPRQRPSSAVIAREVAATRPRPLVPSAEVHPEPSAHRARGNKHCDGAVTPAPTLRVSRASTRRHSGRSASMPSQHRWKNLAEVMRRYQEQQALQAQGAERGVVEDQEEGQERLVKIVFNNVCYLLPVKADLPKQEVKRFAEGGKGRGERLTFFNFFIFYY